MMIKKCSIKWLNRAKIQFDYQFFPVKGLPMASVRFKKPASRCAAIFRSLIMAALTLLCAPALASVLPVNQCVDAGYSASNPEQMGSAPGAMSFTASVVSSSRVTDSETPSSSLGHVDPASGAFIYTHEDISVGFGAFPARLSVQRTFNSRMVRNTYRQIFSPGGRVLHAFGRGSTHNLDIRYKESELYFDGKRYPTVQILGVKSLQFQKCADGQYRSLQADGHRLVADSSFGPGGFRLDDRDGASLYFQGIAPGTGWTKNCGGGWKGCGILRRWVAPNGDWAEFTWQEYYSHPTNQSYPSSAAGPWVRTGYGTRIECHVTLKGVSECKDTDYPWYLMDYNSRPATLSYGVMDHRLTEVKNSRGYRLLFTYLDPTVTAGGYCPYFDAGGQPSCSPAENSALKRNRVSSISVSHDNGTGYVTLAQVGYSYVVSGFDDEYLRSFTSAHGTVTRYGPMFSEIYLPGYATPNLSISYANAESDYYFRSNDEYYNSVDGERQFSYYPAVTKLTFSDGKVNTYAPTYARRWMPDVYGKWVWQQFVRRMVATDPAGSTTFDFVDPAGEDFAEPAGVIDPLGRTTTSVYSNLGALTSRRLPEGNVTTFSYDARGNLLSRTQLPKNGSGSIQEAFTYVGPPALLPEQCVNQRTCNKVLSTTDARGTVRDFTWHEASGEPASMLDAAPTSGADRPLRTYTYVLAGSQIYLLQSITDKISASASVVSQMSYDGAIRRSPRMIEVTADGLTRRSCFTYDVRGRKISETTPNANLATCP